MKEAIYIVLYKIYPKTKSWITGWEISKLIFNNICSDDNININGLFANTSSDFISGFLYYQLTSQFKNPSLDNISKFSCKYYTYNCNFPYENKLIAKTYKKENNIIDIPIININNLKFTSSNICRYINNFIRSKSLYLNFSILQPNNRPDESENIKYKRNLIKTILPAFINLHDNHGMLLSCFIWNNNHFNDIVLFIYILNCIFKNIHLIWMPWKNIFG